MSEVKLGVAYYDVHMGNLVHVWAPKLPSVLTKITTIENTMIVEI